jgi:hypothetical protein
MRGRWIAALIVALLLALCGPSHAATRADFPGAWYADALPNRAYVVLVGNSHLETSRGRVELPGQNVLRVRIAPDGIQLAGQGHVDSQAWHWTGSEWIAKGPAHGVGPVIFDRANALHIATPAVGSQGFRFVDDSSRIWTGDETYADRPNHLWEWTQRGSIQCGQGGDEEGLQCLVNGRRVLVEAGIVRFITFAADGNDLALAWTAPQAGRASILWLTAAELNALPTYELPREPVPTPTPSPVPTPTPQDVPSLQGAIEDAFRNEPRPIAKARVGELLNAIARSNPGWGLLSKPSGNNCPMPNGTLVACDILMHQATSRIFDVLADAEGAADPQWGEAGGSPADPTRFVAPVSGNAPTPTPVPVPVPTPTPAPMVDADARQRIAALEQVIVLLRARLDQLEAAPPPSLDEGRVRAIVADELARYRFKVEIGRVWGHSHPATVTPELVR